MSCPVPSISVSRLTFMSNFPRKSNSGQVDCYWATHPSHPDCPPHSDSDSVFAPRVRPGPRTTAVEAWDGSVGTEGAEEFLPETTCSRQNEPVVFKGEDDCRGVQRTPGLTWDLSPKTSQPTCGSRTAPRPRKVDGTEPLTESPR